MSSAIWTSNSIKVSDSTFVEARANDKGVVLAQGDAVWFHDLHLTPQQAADIAAALYQGAVHCLDAQLEAKK